MSNSEDNNEGNFDLSGVFHIQSDYLTDMSNSVTYEDVNYAPRLAEYVLKLQEKVREARNSYTEADTSADSILTEQEKVIDIVTEEQKRLDEKAFLIEQAEETERRKVLLTESNTLRKAEYTKIIMIFIICIAIHIILLLIVKYLVPEPMDPKLNTFFILLHLFNFALWTIVAFYIFVTIQSRSQINFNKLELPPPSTTSTPSTSPSTNTTLLKDLGFCYTDSCCGSNTTFDESSGECVANSSTPSNEGFISDLTIKPAFVDGETSEGVEINSTYGYGILPQEEPKPFDISTASFDEKKNYYKQQMKGQFSSQMASSGSIQSMTEVEDNVNLSLQEQLDNLDLGNSLASEGSVKCYFTTMSDSPELNCSKNRAIYQPNSQSELLPRNGVLDHTMFYEGINTSENLTNTYSNYN